MHPAGCLTQPHIALMRRCPRARARDATTTRRDAGWSSRSGCRLAVVCTMRWTPYGRTAAPVGRYMWGTRLQRAGQRALLLSMASRTSSTALTTWPTFAKAPACPATHPLATRHLHTSLPILHLPSAYLGASGLSYLRFNVAYWQSAGVMQAGLHPQQHRSS